MHSRREFLICSGMGIIAFRRAAAETAAKPMRGIFPVMSTPFTAAKAVDYDDLGREVEFMDRCGVAGIVWPQLASEYMTLSREERLKGMEVVARAARGKKPALVLGVQGPDADAAAGYARHAEELAADAMIAIPPTEAKSLDDFRQYYRALARVTRRPIFIQTTGGAKGIILEVQAIVDLAREFPNLGYVKEEQAPVLDRMIALSRHRPAMKGIFSGAHGRAMLHEMRLGFEGTMPGAPYADIHAQIWELFQSGKREQARDLFARLMLMINLEQQITCTRQYMMQKRGIFKTTVSRRETFELTREAIEEIEFSFAALKPYLRA